MIDAYQTTIIAAIDNDGFIIHYTRDCIGEDEWDTASIEWKANGELQGQFSQYLEKGYSPLTRYEIHEMAVQMYCDECGARIE